MTYKGKYKCKNPHKYLGDINYIFYRSSWELSTMVWLDSEPNVLNWSSETVIIPYLCATDNKYHRYYPDFLVKFKSGTTSLFELKPNNQTKPPTERKRQTAKYLQECQTYIKNQCKWEAAKKYAEERNWKFYILTKQALKEMGVKVI